MSNSKWTLRVVFVLAGAICISRGWSQSFAGGKGTAADPYQIASATQLQAMRYEKNNVHYLLTADIDASVSSTWNAGAGFLPYPGTFQGTFDGDGHSITGLTIKRSMNEVGLFGSIGDTGIVQNLKLVNASIQGTLFVGALAGMSTGLIRNVSVTGTIIATDRGAGGISGRLEGEVRDSWVNVSVQGKSSLGGLAGVSDGAYLWRTYSLGSIKGIYGIGGLIGTGSTSTSHSYSRATLEGDSLVGGLVGDANSANFFNSWAATPITATKDEGGLIARCFYQASCKATESFWEKTISGVDSSRLGILKSTADLKLATTFASATWDLGHLWEIDAQVNDGFPTNSKKFSGTGKGTLKNPYQIKTLAQLQEMRLDPWGHYALMNDINASDTKNWNSGKGFRPNPLTGSSLDGKGFTIDSLYINRPTEKFVGLLSRAADILFIKNLNLDSATVVGSDSTGGLAGHVYGDSLYGIKVTSAVAGRNMSGGIWGAGGADEVRNIEFNGTISGNINVGGLAGYIGARRSSALKSNAIVTGDSAVGGLFGTIYLDTTKVSKWTSLGSVTGKYAVGGLVGNWYKGDLDSSSTLATVSGIRRVGGLLGEMNCPYRCKIMNSYAENTVTVTEQYGGGLIGYAKDGTIFRSHTKTNVVASGASRIGGLIGMTYWVKMDSSWAEGTLSANSEVGGLVGSVQHSSDSIMNSWSSVTVTSGENSAAIGGLVGSMWEGRIEKSHASGAVSGNSYVGGLVGLNRVQIHESYATGKVVGEYYVGGLVGADSLSKQYGRLPALITRSYATGVVEGVQGVGGLAGVVYGSILFKSYATGSVTGTHSVGGLVGQMEGAISSRDTLLVGENSIAFSCYATGVVTGLDKGGSTGGLVGSLSKSAVINSFALGRVNGSTLVGGLVGNSSQGKIYTSYSVGEVSGTDKVGGLVGYAGNGVSQVEGGLWNTTTSKQTTSAIGSGVTTTQLKDLNYISTAGLDVKGIWTIAAAKNSGYPSLLEFSGVGNGTGSNPYQINTNSQLQQMEADPFGSYVLKKSLDLAETKDWNGGKGWIPLGRRFGFLGQFEGNGFVLQNLWCNRPQEDQVGLFGKLAGKLSNLGMKNFSIVGRNKVGGLAGEVLGSDLFQYFDGKGLKKIYAEGSVTGQDFVGGFLGYNQGGELPEESYSNSTVKGDSLVGGIVGYGSSGVIKNSYVRGVVAGRASVGGMIGGGFNGGILNSYVAAKVTGEDSVEALVGGTYVLSYVKESSLWDQQIDASMDSRSGTGLNTSAMKQQASFEDYEFDFTNIWAIDASINNGYPYLINLGKPSTSSIHNPSVTHLPKGIELRIVEGMIMRNSTEEGVLQIMDIRGRILGSTNADRFALGMLMPGIYFARFQGQSGTKGVLQFRIQN